MTTFAAAEDYAEYKGLPRDHYDADATEKARITAGLRSAQDDVAAAVYYSVYTADDTEKTEALTRATCARFELMEQTGDDGSGAAGSYDSVRIGSVSLSKGSGAGTVVRGSLDSLGAKPAAILFVAGFTQGAVAHT